MKISIVGVGMGNPATVTGEGLKAIREAECLIGARRLLDSFPDGPAKRAEAIKPGDIVRELSLCKAQRAAVLMSGDVGFYSGTTRLRDALALDGGMFEVESIAGVSSVQYLCARVGESWEDAELVSLHGREGSILGPVLTNGKTFFLTGGENGVREVCRVLEENGLGGVRGWVGEELSYPEEHITYGTAAELAKRNFSPLSVLLVLNAQPLAPMVTHGLPDEAFLRGDAPMTKREVRTAAISALELHPGWTVWDVGAGTGSVSVELARLLPGGLVYAVEREGAALALLEKNKQRFGVQNLRVVTGEAPGALEALPAPDAVFLGGTGGSMAQVFEIIQQKNPAARIVATAILLETVNAVLAGFEAHGMRNVEIVQLTVARAKKLGGGHMMMGQNPVTILSGGGRAR